MNKNIIYITIAVLVGLLGGWLIFGGSSDASMSNKDVSDMSDNQDHSTEGEEEMWTCSMHPQIMQPEPGDCPICGMDLIPAESSADGLAADQFKMTKNAMALANIQTSIVGDAEGKNGNTISLTGKIVENEEANSVQASYFDGRIESLNVSYEGQEVRKGQLLATIYAPNLVAAQQELITTASLKESQPALYKSVRNKLKLWKLSESQINTIEESGKVRENFPIYATVSGTVSEKMAEEGDYVKQGQPILKLSNLNSVWAAFDAYENQISQFKIGQEIKMTTNAYPNKEFDATISFIDPVLNTQTRVVTVRATIQNNNNLLKPGMFVAGNIEGFGVSQKQQLVVPASAVMWTGERSVVYVKTNPEEPVFEMREVTIGNRNGEAYTITEGLENGDEIVTNGTFTVDAAAQLRGKKSMMNQSNSAEEETIPETKMKLSQETQKAIKKSLKPYLDMKDAFVEGNITAISVYAKKTLEEIKSIPESDLDKMEQSHISKIKRMLVAINEADNIKNQRNHFVVLNQNIVPIVMNIQNIDPEILIQKCPMANNNQGAFWLSADKEIRNPYYGEQMMTCGSTIDTL
ncbi:efflux RND transporter periplasmic adaptor subunit [Leeuwenhoekiella sp. A16]|uniref:efflux RND transporter periplasmic adaptor subunit n=1 Tax=unclassified Leeuwenhoekiella TaxID=2615029 RepID=UPI003A802EFD